MAFNARKWLLSISIPVLLLPLTFKTPETIEIKKKANHNDFDTSICPPLRAVLCGEGAPNFDLASELFRLARGEVFPATTTNTNTGTTAYTPTRPLEVMNTTELWRSLEQGIPSATADQFFHGNWGVSALEGNYTHSTSGGDPRHFWLRYVIMWKGANNQIRGLEDNFVKYLGTAHRENFHMRKHDLLPNEAGIDKPCIYTAVRDPIQHFLSGYNEIEYRELLPKHRWPSAP